MDKSTIPDLSGIHPWISFYFKDNDELVQLTTTNSDDIVVILLVIDLDDLGGQRASFLAILLRAALLVNETVPLVSCLHQFLTLLYGPEEEWGGGLSVSLGHTRRRPTEGP